VPESESEQCEAQVNLVEVAKDPNQSSEEPKASFAQECKPRSITFGVLPPLLPRDTPEVVSL
jgi:hypothetical protein